MITKETVKLTIATEKAIVKFSVTWCGPCIAIKDKVQEIAENHGFRLIEIDIDELPDIADEYKVTGIPHMIVAADGNATSVTGSNCQALENACVKMCGESIGDGPLPMA